MQLENYILGKWIKGDGDGQILYHAVTGESIATVSTKGIDFSTVLHFARQKGNPALRKMTFQERGLMLRAHSPNILSPSFGLGQSLIDAGLLGGLVAYIPKQHPPASLRLINITINNAVSRCVDFIIMMIIIAINIT